MTKPREFWIMDKPDSSGFRGAISHPIPDNKDAYYNHYIHVREISKDEIRVSREDFEILKGFIMFESHAMSDAQAIIERIEQESK